MESRFCAQLQLLVKGVLGKIPLPSTLAHEEGLLETIWLLFTSVLVVPAVCKLPGGSPVLGFLAGGALIGPHALGEPQTQTSCDPARAALSSAECRTPRPAHLTSPILRLCMPVHARHSPVALPARTWHDPMLSPARLTPLLRR